VIDQRFLVQRHSDAPYHAAHDLTGRGLSVQDAASRSREVVDGAARPLYIYAPSVSAS